MRNRQVWRDKRCDIERRVFKPIYGREGYLLWVIRIRFSTIAEMSAK